ncbi:EVE domain-containing protein [Bacillaceae bacterium C204]|uniref:EVE domain-containing protein n=1 Tax=Neobacillus sp. 204 TaxID=3383351 RepID=UPI00397D8441
MGFWIAPVQDIEHIQERGKKDFRKVHGFNPEHIKAGDWILFYKSKVGVIGHARIISDVIIDNTIQTDPNFMDWNYFADVDCIKKYEKPISLEDKDFRNQLDWYEGKKHDVKWANLVISGREITLHDFILLSHGV